MRVNSVGLSIFLSYRSAIMLLKMWLDPGAPPPTGRFTTYTTYRLPTGTLTVYIIPTKAHTSCLRNSFSWHAVADIFCLRQQNVIFHYFHNLPLSQKLDPRLSMVGNVIPDYFGCAPHKCFQLGSLLVGVATKPHSDGESQVIFYHSILKSFEDNL